MKFLNIIKNIFKGFWPVFVLIALNSALFAANYHPGTYLIGWDNLMPELNFGVNFQRSIFSAWQEYQSLGLLGGMGHASDLIHQAALAGLSSIAPNSALRYVWTFISLFLGGLGAYFLAKFLLKDEKEGVNHNLLALTASLFYTLNIATIQTYFVIFETFSAHFASLPWIFLATFVYLKKSNIKMFAFLALVFALSAPSFYVPTIFIVVSICLFIILAVKAAIDKTPLLIIKKGALIFATLFILNSYWLLPFSLFTVKNSTTNITAKIDQMDTTTIYLQNREFGNLIDVAELKGFWFNNVDPDINGNNAYMLSSWRNQFSNPFVTAASLGLFAVIIAGLISFLKKRADYEKLSIAALFIFAFTMLATGALPFSFIDDAFRKLPLFSQAFRFPFTKFGILAALMYSLLLPFGIIFISSKFKSVIRNIVVLIVFVCIFYISSPVFSGNLFYSKERLKIPQEYFSTFNYFAQQDKSARIADLPQPTFWGWTNYSWGNGGSGFLWYGIQQPILDRAFDVWSKTSEKYYDELSQALYSKDAKALEMVFEKYQVSYVLLDENVIYPSSPKSLLYPETEAMLSKIANVKLEKSFGKIRIYSVKLSNKPDSFIFTLPSNLQSVTQPFWSTTDPAYSSLGNYISSDTGKIVYPFGSLFTQKKIEKPLFNVSKQDKNITISTTVKLNTSSAINIPDFLDSQDIVPVSLYKSQDSEGNVAIFASVGSAQVTVDDKKVASQNSQIALLTLPAQAIFPVRLNVNGVSNFVISNPNGQNELIGTTFLLKNVTNQIVVSGKNILSQSSISDSFLNSIKTNESVKISAGTHTIAVVFPKIDDSYLSINTRGESAAVSNCNSFRTGESNKILASNSLELSNTNSSYCASYDGATLFSNQGYAVFTDTKNLRGGNLHFWVLNEDEKHTPLDTYLSDGAQSFVLPSEQDSGLGYSFHFENSSIGNDTTENTINSLSIYPIPYKFITGIYIGEKPNQLKNVNNVLNVSHPNESLYVVNMKPNTSTTLVLSQSYDSGWNAYVVNKNPGLLTQIFPFIFGKDIQNHIEVNGWENGWKIDGSSVNNNQSIVILYLPQYLEYAGFILMLGMILVCAGLLIRKKVAKRNLLKQKHSYLL